MQLVKLYTITILRLFSMPLAAVYFMKTVHLINHKLSQAKYSLTSAKVWPKHQSFMDLYSASCVIVCIRDRMYTL